MVRREIVELLRERCDDSDRPFDRRLVAAAALVVECARIDADFADEELEAMDHMVREELGFDRETVDALMEIAERKTVDVWHDWIFLEAIKQGFTHKEQIEIVERLWQIAYADGIIHPFEEQLLARIARALSLSNRERESARQAGRERAEARATEASGPAGGVARDETE